MHARGMTDPLDPADDPGLDPDQPGQELDESVSAEFPPDGYVGLDGVIGDAEDDEDDDDLDDEDAVDADDDFDDEFGDDDDLEPEVWEDGPEGGSGPAARGPGEPGPLADDDEFTGDESERDYATEHVAEAAEDDALHVEPHRFEEPG